MDKHIFKQAIIDSFPIEFSCKNIENFLNVPYFKVQNTNCTSATRKIKN